jgi:F-type H+-transporting ATPase subunit b
MLIDWFTVVAQALNFLILVWLLKRFLYKPILDALDAREKRIAAELADADAKQAEAREERDAFARKNQELDQQRETQLKKAAHEADIERRRLLDEVRKEAETARARWQESLLNEHQSLNADLTRRTREEVFAIVQKTLADLATNSLEEQMTEAFIRRLRELSLTQKEVLKAALQASSTPPIIRTTFELPDARRGAIERAVKDILSIDSPIHFETSPDLVSGIELTADGHKVAWSIGQYLTSLKQRVQDILPERFAASGAAGKASTQRADGHHG